MREGGFLKWQRTKRQVQYLNKAGSMFEATHLVSSGNLKEKLKQEHIESLKSLNDLGFNRKYDESLPNQICLGGISQQQRSSIGQHFDHSIILDNKVINYDDASGNEGHSPDDTLCFPSKSLANNSIDKSFGQLLQE